MEFLVALLGLGSILVGIVALIGVIRPMARIGLNTRKQALGIFVLSFISFVIATAVTPETITNADGSWWPWILFISLAYGLFRLARRGRQKERVGTKRDSATFYPEGPNPSLTSMESTHVRMKTGRGASRHATEGITSETREARKRAARWIEPGDTATVAGHKIGGMIYLGPEPRQENWKQEGSPFIDPGLPVAKVGSDISGESMPYWPSYSDINPGARATYLDWLASGRSDERYGPGYVFIYFYGLERRFFMLTTPTEAGEDTFSWPKRRDCSASTARTIRSRGI